MLPPEIFLTLWANIEQMIATGSIRAIDVVRDELGRRDDATRAWAAAQEGLFVILDGDVQGATSKTLAAHPKLMGRGGGRNAADPFVIGLARAHGGIVVTEETPTGNLERPRIPDVCSALGVRCVNLIGFVRDQGWTF
ncbi:MAG: DUF4411 family protein [Pseudonocardiaceae bacterium]